jgi:hypothetical protein
MKVKGNTNVKLSNLTLGLPSQNVALQRENGAPGEIRTPDPLLRRQMLYPAELRAHGCVRLILKYLEPFRTSKFCRYSISRPLRTWARMRKWNSGVSQFANRSKCIKMNGSSHCGRVAQLGEHLLCKTQGKSHKCRIWCRLRGKRTVQPFS